MSKQKLKYGINQDEIHTTVKGISVFPKLIEPDTKFNKDGLYLTRMKFAQADEEALIALLAPMAATALAEAKKEEKNKTLKSAAMPWKPEVEKVYDGEGNVVEENETGFMLFNFKLKAKVTSKSGKVIFMKPKIYDASNPPKYIGNTEGLSIGGGSELKVAFTVRPFYMAKEKEVGLSLQIQAVQIINLVEFGVKSAKELGFGAEEGGFDGSDSDEPSMPSAGDSASASAKDADF